MWTVVIFFIIIISILLYLDSLKPKNFPPGPSWLPIFGSALALNRLRKKTGYLYKASEQLSIQYGGVVGLRVGKDRIVVAYSFDALREVFTKDTFQGRPKGPFYETRTWGLRRGILLVDEQFWIEQRRFTLRQLREFGFGKQTMSEITENESAFLAKDVKGYIDNTGTNGTVIQMDQLFGVYVLNTLWSLMASQRYSPEESEAKELQTILSELFETIDMAGSLFSHFPILQYVAPNASGYNYFVNIHRRFWKFLRAELERHKATYKPGVTRDFMDAYLEVLQSETKSSTFSELQLIAICMDFFIAGSETTSKSLAFGFLHLLLNPEVQRKAQEEIDRVVGQDRLPQVSDRPNMPYVEGLVLESIRMFMSKAIGVPHRTLQDTTLQGYFVPKDTMILCNFSGLMNDWEDPEVFRPDRFIKNDKIVSPDSYTPFGFGKHRCVGETLAKANIFTMTAALLQKFDFHLVPGSKPPNTEGIDACTPATEPYKALVTLRKFN